MIASEIESWNSVQNDAEYAVMEIAIIREKLVLLAVQQNNIRFIHHCGLSEFGSECVELMRYTIIIN
jgi:hypothetical protein